MLRLRTLGALGAALALSALSAGPAAARSTIGIDRTLSGPVYVSAASDAGYPRQLVVLRNGAEIARRDGDLLALASIAPGDTVVLFAGGAERLRRTFDGHPTIPAACVGATRFVGTRSGPAAAYETSGVFTPMYVPYSRRPPTDGLGQLGVSTDTSLEVLVPSPLRGDQAVFLGTVVLSGGDAFSSTVATRVRACAPDELTPTPKPKAKAKPKVQVLGAKVRRGLAGLRRGRLTFRVRAPGAGRITQRVQLAGTRTSRRGLVGRGTRTARKRGTLTVRISTTRRARSLARTRKRLHIVVTTTFTPKGGRPARPVVTRLTLRR